MSHLFDFWKCLPSEIEDSIFNVKIDPYFLVFGFYVQQLRIVRNLFDLSKMFNMKIELSGVRLLFQASTMNNSHFVHFWYKFVLLKVPKILG